MWRGDFQKETEKHHTPCCNCGICGARGGIHCSNSISLCSIILPSFLLKDLILYLKDYNLSGFECLFPIPATVGGLLANNASDNKVAFSDFVLKLIVLDNKGKVITLTKA